MAAPALSHGVGRTALALELALRHLGMDAVYVAQVDGGTEVARWTAGDATRFGVEGGRPPGPGAQAGATLEVPLVLADGTAYGELRCLRSSPTPALDARDRHFLALLAELVVADLQQQRDDEQVRRQLAQLIDQDRMRVAYQPIVDLKSGHLVGLEALARFPEPFSRPDQTFATSYSLDRVLGVRLEGYALRRGLEILPLLGPGQFVSLNLSPVAALELARRYTGGLDLTRIVLEITEHELVPDYADLQAQLEPLRAAGMRISVDDAGAGYASLQHIVELHPDFIKVDRSLIDRVASDKARRVATTVFVLLGLELDATVIAEGVESPHDLVALCDLGVDAAQGYLLGRPSTETGQLEKWTSDGRLLVAR